MKPTYSLRSQNARILDALDQLESMLDPMALRADARSAHLMLTYLLRWSLVHLAMEETMLFPMLRRNIEPSLRRIASRYERELKHLTVSCTEHDQAYAQACTIQAAPETFIAETCRLAKSLRDRMLREESELFALADRVVFAPELAVNPS